jgi:protein-S-isoprenylcysteine O-methyltransferase Ste14
VAAALVRPDPSLFRIGAGMGIIGMGCLFHLLIKGQLIRNVVLCNQGFYSIVRHPYYFSNFVIDGGFCILSGSEILLYLFPFIFFWAYGPALNNEEKHLEEIHGQAYRDFRALVPQMLPSTGSSRLIPQMFRSFSGSRISLQEFKRILRMASAACLVAFVNSARALPSADLSSWPPSSRGQWQAAVFGGLSLLLLLLGLLIPRSRRKEGPEGDVPPPSALPLASGLPIPPVAAPEVAPLPSAEELAETESRFPR